MTLRLGPHWNSTSVYCMIFISFSLLTDPICVSVKLDVDWLNHVQLYLLHQDTHSYSAPLSASSAWSSPSGPAPVHDGCQMLTSWWSPIPPGVSEWCWQSPAGAVQSGTEDGVRQELMIPIKMILYCCNGSFVLVILLLPVFYCLHYLSKVNEFLSF